MAKRYTPRVLVLADVCADSVREFDVDAPDRQTGLAIELAERAIHETRRRMGVDAVVLVGDLVADASRPHAASDLAELHRRITDAAGEAGVRALPSDGQRELVACVFDTSKPPLARDVIESAVREAGPLCLAPFRFAVITVDGAEATTELCQLAASRPGLWDTHNHTELAYCATTSTAAGAVARMHTFGLAGLCLAEHAGQLYVDANDFWSARFIREPDLWKRTPDNRVDEYLRMADPLRSPHVRVGFETELDRDGDLILRDEDRQRAQIILGAVHWLNVDTDGMTNAQLNVAYLRQVEQMLTRGVDVMAHPLRLFYRTDWTLEPGTASAVAKMLAETDTPAELNIHKNEPVEAFYAEVIERGVKISLGSDSHVLWEVGMLGWHVEFLRRVAGTDDISPLLWQPTDRQ